MAIERIEVVQLPVHDLARAREFYARVLAAAPSVENPPGTRGGSALFDFAERSASLHLQEPPSPYGAPDAPIVALQVAPGTDVEGLMREIEAAGGTVTSRDMRTPDLLVVDFTDTEGNHLELLIRH